MVFCCFGKSAYRKCIGRPYRNDRLLSAQICSIIAAFPTVVNLVPFSLSLIVATWFQMLCCFRVSRGNLQWLIVLSMATALSIICSGLFADHHWGPYFLMVSNPNYLLVTCIVSGLMWVVIAFKVVFFLDGGDYARLEYMLEADALRRQNMHDFYDGDDDDHGEDDDYDVEILASVEIPQESRETNNAIRVLLEQVDLEAHSGTDEMASIALDSVEASTHEESDPDQNDDIVEPIEALTVEADPTNDQVENQIEECSSETISITDNNVEATQIAARESGDSSRRRSMALEINRAGQIFHVSRSFTGEPGERNDGRLEDSLRGRSRVVDPEDIHESDEHLDTNTFNEP